ncbi:MAG: hypothetical protein AB7U38_08720 [Hyphomicrobiales bacterium]
MQDTSRRLAIASTAALLAAALAAPAAAATFTNTCNVITSYTARKLGEGSPVSATGKLEIRKLSSGFAASLVNHEGKCAVALEGDQAQMKPVAACGHGAKATIEGIFTEELMVAAIIPSVVSCH